MKTSLYLLAAVLAPALSFGGPRTSANYTIATDTADGGGRRATSAAYTNDGSAGGIVGISTVASPAQIARHGYVGQLFDVTGVSIAASPATVNEGTSRQLTATATLDDATTITLAGTEVAWSIVSGPLSFISANGLATAGNVYQNTAAIARGGYQLSTGTAALTVVNVSLDNFGAYAGDTLDDAWQVQYFGQSPNTNAGPLVDFDGDGQTNLFEYTAGLVPTDAASQFSITIAPVVGQPGRKNIIFKPLVLTGGRSYAVKFRLDLATGAWTTLTGTTQSDAGAQRTVTDTTATGAKKFYQVEITKP